MLPFLHYFLSIFWFAIPLLFIAEDESDGSKKVEKAKALLINNVIPVWPTSAVNCPPAIAPVRAKLNDLIDAEKDFQKLVSKSSTFTILLAAYFFHWVFVWGPAFLILFRYILYDEVVSSDLSVSHSHLS